MPVPGCLTADMVVVTVSALGLMTGSAWTFLGCVGVTFFVGGFEAADGFETVGGFVAGVFFGAAVTGMFCFTHSRKVISSNAKSFPQPLGTSSAITSTNAEVEAGVVK